MPELTEITIAEKKYYAKFGMRELMQTAKFAKSAESGNESTPEELENAIALDYDVTLAIFHSALQSGCKRKNVKYDLSVEDLEDALDEDPAAFFALQTGFTESKAIQAMSKKKS